MPQDPWDDHNAHLVPFPDHLLFDIARNEAAQRAYRRHAVEILVNRKSPKVKHPDLADLVAELEIELDGIQFEYPAPSGPGPLIASVTTETMQANEVVPATVEFHTDEVRATLPEHSGSVLVIKPTEKETDVREDDTLLRGSPRTDDAEQGRLLPGEQKPAARRNRNKASAPASETV